MRAIRKREAQRGSTLQVILGVIGGLLIVTVLCVFVAVWVLKNYVGIEVERSDDAKRVAVHTPIGDVEVEKAEEVADRLKLPIYPGAEPADEGASVRVRGRLWGEEGGTNVTAAYFYTDASFDEVDDWYREQLGSNFVRQKGELVGEATVGSGEGGMQHDWEVQVKPEGDDVVYSQERAGRLRGLVLKRKEGRVKFGLFDIAGARHQ
jgi:hypothetical protein